MVDLLGIRIVYSSSIFVVSRACSSGRLPCAFCRILYAIMTRIGELSSRPDPLETRMTTRTRPPFRADHVGSFLRPKYLLDAREQRAKGEITRRAAARASKTARSPRSSSSSRTWACSRITDGEFRRTYFHIDFLEQLGGVKTDIPVTIKKPDGTEELAPPVMRVVDKVRHVKDIQRADFEYLKSQVARRAARPRSRSRRRRCCTFAAAAPASAASTTPSSTRRSTTTSPRPTATSCARSPPPAAPTCRWTTPTWPTCATRRCARRRASAATTRTSCRTATPASSTRWSRKSPPA